MESDTGAWSPEPWPQDTPQRFCRDFTQLLRTRQVSLRTAAAKSHWGKTTIASAGRGPDLPNRDLVRDVLTATGTDPDEVTAWLRRYDMLRTASVNTGADEPGSGDNEQEPANSANERARGHPFWPARWPVLPVWGWLAATALIIAACALVVIALRSGPSGGDPDHRVSPSSGLLAGRAQQTVIVQNKVAIGPARLEEDDSPSYLSTRPVARCANIGCKLAGTDMYSGATLTVTCHLQGELLTNADVSSPGIKSNPNIAASTLWYLAIWPDGRSGYISEVYIAPAYRGGLNLPQC